jgi:zinc/manganese transport system substrate-binding protein
MLKPMSLPARLAALAVAAAGLALAMSGCASHSTAPARVDGTVVISAVGAENQYASVLSQIGGRYVHVTSVLDSPSTDPHTFEASPQVASEVAHAQLIVQNGLGYDTWIAKMEAATPAPGRKVIVAQHVLGLPDSTPNPHLWYRPATMPAVARVITADLSALRPARAAYFRANLAAFDRSLRPWLRAIAAFRAAYPGAAVASTEPVADYLLTAMGTHNLAPFWFQADVMNGVDPAPEGIALMDRLVSQHRVAVLVYNQQVTGAITASIRQSAHDAGVPVVAVYETMPTPGYRYQSWMLAEMNAIRRAVASKISTQRL